MRRPLLPVLALVSLGVLAAGCSVKARPMAMVPQQLQLEHHHPYTVMIDTVGTEGDEIITATLIKGNDLAAALERTIVETKLFSSVVRSSQADYRLLVEAKATAPAAGFNMTTRVGGAWKLTHQKSGKVVFDEFIKTQATKTVGDAFVGTTRVRMSIEEAAQNFVREGVTRLGRLTIE